MEKKSKRKRKGQNKKRKLTIHQVQTTRQQSNCHEKRRKNRQETKWKDMRSQNNQKIESRL